MHLQGSQQNTGVVLPCEEEVEMLHNAVRTSSEDLSIISETIEQRTKNYLFVIKNCRCYDHNKMSNFLKKVTISMIGVIGTHPKNDKKNILKTKSVLPTPRF